MGYFQRVEATPPLFGYRQKRDPERTPEPFATGTSPPGCRFVIQKHSARRLHYDLRLEIAGVLKSWAVPKGPSVDPEEKRLAVQMEDHPIEYANFEGVIPRGNYGAGPVIVWDRGRYHSAKAGDALEHLKNGHLEIEFYGYKMRGLWTLIRLPKEEKTWLLFKQADAFAGSAEITESYPHSVLCGLTLEEIADVPGTVLEITDRLRKLNAPARSFSASDQPLMLATLQAQAFSAPEWLFEIKYDGVRVLAERNGDQVELYGRNQTVISNRYPELRVALKHLPFERFIIDGEVVALDEMGRPSFQGLQARMHLTRARDIEAAAVSVPVQAVFFDCLALAGHDLRGLPLLQRKELLKAFLPPLGLARYGDHVVTSGKDLFEGASEMGLEGIIAKRTNSRYAAGRSRDWLKIKCHRRQEFVIGGYTEPQGERACFGALHLGLYQREKLIYISKVGTGFDSKTLQVIWEKMQPLKRATSPFLERSPSGRGHTWVEPKLVCEVRFSDWTHDGGIRHPSFLGLRTDKKPEDCLKEEPEVVKTRDVAPVAPEDRASRQREVSFTHLNKIFWPGDGFTKGDLIEYYRAIAPCLLPYLKGRPLVLTRYPDGITGKSFFQKDAPEFVPDWVRTVKIHSKDSDRNIAYIIVDDLESLLYVINMGTIPLHLWSSRVGSLERPDWLVLDLDPKGAPFADVVKVARSLNKIFEQLGLESFVKTSGASGLHILLPLGARYTHEQAKNFARLLAMLGHQAVPEISTIARPLGARGGKVYIDFGQNGYGVTIAAPFAARPLPGATVSSPLVWEEVNEGLHPSQFTIKTILARPDKLKKVMIPVLRKTSDLAAALEPIERMFPGPSSAATKN